MPLDETNVTTPKDGKVVDEAPIYGGFDEFNYESVAQGIEQDQSEMGGGFGDLDIDQDFKNAMDAAAVEINKFPIGSTGSVNSVYPGNATTTYNPYVQKAGPDLSTPEGRRRFMLGASIESGEKYPDETPGYTDPIEVGIKSSNFDRYYKSGVFSNLGWHPYSNNEEFYNKNSSTWDDLARMGSEYWGLAGTGFLSVYRSVGDIFDSDSYLEPDIESAGEFENAMRIGNSTRGGMAGFTNNFLLNSAYTVGIIGSIAVEELALAGITALMPGAAPVTGAKTVQNLSKIGRVLMNSFDLTRMTKATANLIKTLKNADAAKAFYTFGRFGGNLIAPETLYAIRSLKTAKEAGTNLSNIAKANKFFGGFYRDARAINLAMAESKMESGMVYNNMLDNLYTKYKKENNGAFPPPDELRNMNDYSNRAAFAATLWNFPLIYGTNRIVLDGALRGFKPMGRIMDENLTGIGSRLLRNKEYIKKATWSDIGGWALTTPFKRLYNVGIRGGSRAFGAGALRYLTANFAEGIQELGQEGIAVGTEDYYTGLYNDPMAGGAELFKASVASAVDSQMGAEGFEVFMSGFLMGGLVQGPQKAVFEGMPYLFQKTFQKEKHAKYLQAKEDYVKKAVKALNEAQDEFMNDPGVYFNESTLNALSQKQLSVELFEASLQSDVLSYMDAKDQMVMQHLYTMAYTGKMFEFRDQLQSFLKLNDEDLAGAFPDQKRDVKNGKLRSRIQKMVDRSHEIEKDFNDLNDKFLNPYDRHKFTKGTKEYNTEALKELGYQHAKFLMLFTRSTFQRAVERSNEIYQKFSTNPIISKIAANEIATFTNVKNLKTEIETLNSELELEATTEEEKAIQVQKETRLNLLMNYFDVLSNDKYVKKNSKTPANPYGIFDRRRMPKLRKPFVAILKHIAETQEDFVNTEMIDDVLKDIVDYTFLKGRIQDYLKAIDTLIEPERMDLLADRLTEVMATKWASRKKDVTARISKYIDKLEDNQFLNDLSKHGIYPSPESVEGFLGAGVIPTSFMDEDGFITPQTDPDKWELIQGLVAAYRSFRNSQEEATVATGEAIEEDPYDEEEDDDFLSNIVSRAGESPTQQRARQLQLSLGTVKLLNVHYRRYLEQGGKETAEEWKRGTEAQKIIKTRKDLENLWLADVLATEEGQVLDDDAIEEGIESGVFEPFASFEGWLKENKTKLRKAINKYGLTFKDVSIEAAQSNVLTNEDLTGGGEIVAGNKDFGFYVKKVKWINDNGVPEETYIIINSNQEDIHEIYGKLFPFIERTYTTKEAARLAITQLIAEPAFEKTAFKFGGQPMTTGTIVQDENGNLYEVLSRASYIEKHGNLLVVPQGQAKFNKAKQERTFLDEQDWIDDSWKVYLSEEDNVEFDFAAPVKDEGVIKLKIGDPIKFYPYKKDDESKAAAYERFSKFLNNLTPVERNSLEVVISRNKKWGPIEKIIQEGDETTLEVLQGDEGFKKKDGSDYDPNPQIRKGAERLTIKIQLPSNLVAKYKSILGDDFTQYLGFFQGPTSSIFITKEKKGIKSSRIDPLTIDPQQVQQIFTFTGTPTRNAQRVRANYASALATMEIFENLLTKKNSTTITMKELKDHELKLTLSEGMFEYNPDKPQRLIDLDFHTVGTSETTGEPIYWIMDFRQKYNKKGVPVPEQHILTNLDPGDDQYASLAYEIDDALDNNKSYEPKKYLGRYVAVVKQPNGVFTFVELKSEKLDEEEISNKIIELINQQSETAKPVKDGGNIKRIDDEGNRVTETSAYNHIFNDEFNNAIYIASRPGMIIDIKVQKSSDITLTLTNKNKPKSTGGFWTRQYTFDIKYMEGVENATDFIERVNAKIQKVNKEVHKENLTYTGKNPTGYVLKMSDFRRGLPKTIDFDESIISTTETTLQNPLRSKQRLELVYTNSAKIGVMLDIPAVTPIVQPVKKTKESLFTTAEFGKWAKENNEFDSVPEKIIDSITEKINDTGVDSLTDQETIIYETRQNEIDTEVIDNTSAENLEGVSNIKQIERLKELRTQIENLKDKIFEEVKAEKLAEGENLSTANIAAAEASENDPQVLEWEEEKKRIDKSIGFKITENFDNENVEDINVFIKWAIQNLPDSISIEDIDSVRQRLVDNGYTVGAFVLALNKISGGTKIGGTIYTGATSPYRYHEAFHAVFRMLLTDSEISNYLNIGRKELRKILRSKKGYDLNGTKVYSLQEALDTLRMKNPIYIDLTEEELEITLYEEYIADEFEKFKMNQKVNPEMKSLFERILEWIISVFNRFTKNELRTLFEKIDAGKYKSTSIRNNVFTREIEGGITSTALKAIPIDEIYLKRVNKLTGEERAVKSFIYLPQEKSRRIIASIGKLYLDRERKIVGEYSPEKEMDIAITDIIEMYNPKRTFYAAEENGKSYKVIRPKLKQIHGALKIYKADLKAAVVDWLELFNVQADEERYNEETFEADFGLRTTEQWDLDASMMGGFNSLANSIRKFIATTTITESDEFGNVFLRTLQERTNKDGTIEPEEEVRVSVDYTRAYNGLLKAVQGETDGLKMLQKMLWFSEGNPETQAVVDRIFEEIGVTQEQIESGVLPGNEISNPIFYQSIINGFTQYRIDYIFVHTDLKGNVHLYAANNKDDANTQLEWWSQGFDIRRDAWVNELDAKGNIIKRTAKDQRAHLTKVKLFLDKLKSWLASDPLQDGDSRTALDSSRKSVTDGLLANKSKELSNELYDLLGIKLSPVYLAYSIASGIADLQGRPKQAGLINANSHIKPLTKDDIYEISAILDRKEHLFLNIDGEGASTRLRIIALANAHFDENVGATVFRGPDGNLRYAHQMPTFHLEKIHELNNLQGIDDIMDNDLFLANNYLLNSPRFKRLAEEGKLIPTRISGSKKGDLQWEDTTGEYHENNFLDINKNPGVAFGDSSPQQFVLDLIALYTSNWNRQSQRVKGLTPYLDSNGKVKNFATAPIYIRVLEAANTGDLIPLPIIKAVETDEEGGIVVSDEVLEFALNEIKNEFAEIVRMNDPNASTGKSYIGKDDIIKGWNTIDPKKGVRRGDQLTYTRNLLIKKSLASLNRAMISDPLIGDSTRRRLIKGTQNMIVRDSSTYTEVGIDIGDTATVKVKEVGELVGGEFKTRVKGYAHINDLDVNQVLEQLGESVSIEGSKDHKTFNRRIKFGDKVFWTDTKHVWEFLTGAKKKYIYEMVPIEGTFIEEPIIIDVQKVISGGQTGVDRIGLEAGIEAQILTGGTATKGYKTELEEDESELLKEYGLKEAKSADYKIRTELNVKNATGTVLFGDMKSAGSAQTLKFIKKYKKPHLINPSVKELQKWLSDNKIKTLNVAGNRASKLTDEELAEYKSTLIEALTYQASIEKVKGDAVSIEEEDLLDPLANIKPVYSAVFVDQDQLRERMKIDSKKYPNQENMAHHSTIQFKPTMEEVDALPIGTTLDMKIIGRLQTDKVDVLIVDNPYSKNTHPHITLATAKGVKAVASNKEIAENYTKIQPLEETIGGVIGIRDQKTGTDITDIVTSASQVNEFEVDTELVESLEEAAVNGSSFKDALNTLGQTPASLKEIIAARLMINFKKFKTSLKEIKALDKISDSVDKGLRDKNGQFTEASEDAMDELFNLRQGEIDYNLAQVFFNDWVNTKSFNQTMSGNEAISLQDAIDQIKRAKGRNAGGANASHSITAPKYGINHTLKGWGSISLFGFEDPGFTKKYELAPSGKPGEEANAQMYITTKAFLHFWFGLGRLSDAQAALIDKIENGAIDPVTGERSYEISADEALGSVQKGTKGYKQLQAMLNSKKFVYQDDRGTYLKMSAFVLTKQYTSRLDEHGNWVALENRKELHNLRVKMENWEKGKGKETVAIALPESGIKNMKRNLATAEEAFSDNLNIDPFNITKLDAKWMKLQMINPSNKIEITDPVQIKALIDDEHVSDKLVVVGMKGADGEPMTVGQIREAYNKSIADRVTLKYLDRRALVFTLDTAMRELHKSIKSEEITPDLRAFLRYAIVNLQASQARSQMLEFFTADETGEQMYDLNSSITKDKFIELFLAYFSKGILREKIPGISYSLVSGKGSKVFRRVYTLDKNGQPDRSEVIRTDEWKRLKQLGGAPELARDNYSGNIEDKTYINLDQDLAIAQEQGRDHIVIVDDLRANVKDYKFENGKWIDQETVSSEYIAPPHFKSLMDHIILSEQFKAKEEMQREYEEHVDTKTWSPWAHKDIRRKDFYNFDDVRAKIQFAAFKGYTYNEAKDEFEDYGNRETQKIPEVVAKAFGVRIPSQDKHSAINLKMVDFLPVFYGSSAIFPHDLVEISGADFDIDKLYTQIKEFYNVGADFYEYGKPEKIYDVVVDMYEHKTIKDKTGDPRDIWIVDDLDQAEEQLRLIKDGLGGGKNFGKITQVNKYTWIIKHKKGDDKYIYLKGNKQRIPKAIVKDSKRTKGEPYLEDTEKRKFADYIRYIIRDSTIKGSSIYEALQLWDESVPGNYGEQKGVINNYLGRSKIESIIGPVPEESAPEPEWREYREKYKNLFTKALLDFATESDETVMELWGRSVKPKYRGTLMGAMETLFLPISFNEYSQYKEKHKTEPYVGEINNKILDYKYALLGNKNMVIPQHGRNVAIAYEPAVIQPLTDLWEEFEELLPTYYNSIESIDVDVDNLDGKLISFGNNKEGSRSIGAVVLPNVILSILAANNVKIRSKTKTVDGKKIETLPQTRLNGHVYRNFNTRYVIDPQTGKEDTNGLRTQYIVSALITGMTDNAKERMASKLGLNKDALAIVANLVALGVSLKTATLLMLQPTIRAAYFEHHNRENPTDPGVRSMISNRMKQLIEVHGLQVTEKVEVTDALMISEINSNPTNININDIPSETQLTLAEAQVEYSILREFKTAHRLKTYTGMVSALVALNTGLGRDTEAIDFRNLSIEKLGVDVLSEKKFAQVVDENDGLEIPIDVRSVFNEEYGATTWQARYYTIYNEAVDNLLPSVFFTRTKPFVNLKKTVLENLTKDSFYMRPDTMKKIESDLVSYLSLKAYMYGLENGQGNAALLDSLQNGFIYSKNLMPGEVLRIDTVFKRVKKYLAKENIRNKFIDEYVWSNVATNDTNNTGLNRLEANNWTQLNDSQVVDLQRSVLELYSDPVTREDIQHIIHYLLVKDGAQYKGGTFLDVVVPALLDNYLLQTANAHNAFKLTTPTDSAFNNVFGNTLNELKNEFLEGYLTSQNLSWLIKQISYIPVYDPVKYTKTKTKVYGKNINNTVEKDVRGVYVFPDNSVGTYDGARSIRDKINAFGIPLKVGVGIQKDDYYNDSDLTANTLKIDDSINIIVKLSKSRPIIFPLNFLGTTEKERKAEIKRMKKYMSKTYDHLKDRIWKEFGYDIEAGETSQVKKSKEALSKAVYRDEVNKKLIVDLYNGLVTFDDSQSGGRNIKLTSVRKGAKNSKKKPWQIAMSKIDSLKKNISLIAKNFQFDWDYLDNQQKIVVVEFPMVMKVNTGSSALPSFKYYILRKVFRNKDVPATEASVMIAPNEYVAKGNRAEYEELDLEGTYAQNAIGFVFGIRPTFKLVQELVEQKNDLEFNFLTDDILEEKLMNVVDNIDEKDNPLRKLIENADQLSAEGHQVKVTKDGQTVNIANVETLNLNFDNLMDPGVGEEESVANAGGAVTLNNELKERILGARKKALVITEFWQSLTTKQKSNIAQLLKVDTLEGLLEEYEQGEYTSEQNFIDRIKECYGS